MVAELGLYSHDKEKRNYERDVRRRSTTGQIEKELKACGSVAENFMSLNMVSEWLNVEVAIAGLVVGHIVRCGLHGR